MTVRARRQRWQPGATTQRARSPAVPSQETARSDRLTTVGRRSFSIAPSCWRREKDDGRAYGGPGAVVRPGAGRPPQWLYAGRTPRRDHDHRHPDRAFVPAIQAAGRRLEGRNAPTTSSNLPWVAWHTNRPRGVFRLAAGGVPGPGMPTWGTARGSPAAGFTMSCPSSIRRCCTIWDRTSALRTLVARPPR